MTLLTFTALSSRSITDFPVPSALEGIFKSKDEKPDAPPRNKEKDEAKREWVKTSIQLVAVAVAAVFVVVNRKFVVKLVTVVVAVVIDSRCVVAVVMDCTLAAVAADPCVLLPILLIFYLSNFLPRRNKSTGALLSYDTLPESFKKECLVRSKTDHEDEDELRERQRIVGESKPGELAQFKGISDFPLPRKIDTLIRSKRTLKSTKAKESQKRR